MRKLSGNLLFLTGGLGNQLFQLCFGLSVGESGLTLETSKGRPRVSVNGVPDLLEFELPKRVITGNFRNSRFISKVINYNLRIGVVPTGIEKSLVFLKIVKLLSAFLASIHYKKYLKLQVSDGVGFDPKSATKCNSKILVGYYQSYKWLESKKIFNQMASLKLASPSDQFLSLLEEIQASPTIVMHVRLGDYLNESNFGVTTPEYLKNSLLEMYSIIGNARIWGFSDEPEKAKEITSDAGIEGIYWVPPELLTSAETLQLMREGSGFILANSTFSWWAASLRRNRPAPIIAPNPWFKNMNEPRDLVPPDWIRVKAF